MDFSTRLRGINPTNTVFYSPQPRAEVYCLLMNFKISKLVYYKTFLPVRAARSNHDDDGNKNPTNLHI